MTKAGKLLKLIEQIEVDKWWDELDVAGKTDVLNKIGVDPDQYLETAFQDIPDDIKTKIIEYFNTEVSSSVSEEPASSEETM